MSYVVVDFIYLKCCFKIKKFLKIKRINDECFTKNAVAKSKYI